MAAQPHFRHCNMSQTPASDFGLIGLAVMGQNLVLNVESRGFAVSVYNRTPAATEAFVAAHPGKRITGHASLAAFVQSLSRPRRVMLMVKAGAAVDAVIEQLIPLLERDDIIIDGGNSLYTESCPTRYEPGARQAIPTRNEPEGA